MKVPTGKSTKPNEYLQHHHKNAMQSKLSTLKLAKWKVCSEKSVFLGNAKANTLSDSMGVIYTKNGCGWLWNIAN